MKTENRNFLDYKRDSVLVIAILVGRAMMR